MRPEDVALSGWIETYRGVVTAWNCDHQGHMNTVEYYGMFDQAGWHMIQRSGVKRKRLEAEQIGFVDVRMELDFIGEMVVNDPVLIESSVEKIGGKSFTFRSRMSNVGTGEITARGRCTTVHFDLANRVSRTIPDDIRAGLENLLIKEE
jgi:acyl-CoA thioester hydrolase